MKRTLIKFVTRARIGLLSAVAIIAVCSLAAGRPAHATDTAKVTKVALTENDTPIPAHENGFTTSFAPIVKKVAKSVVQINVSAKPKDTPSMDGQGSPDELFRRFFGQQGNGNSSPRRGLRAPREYGLGSGVVVTKDGYILTNNHVVEDADTIKVTLSDGREMVAKVIGRDPKTDVAVLKIDAKDLPFVTLTDSDKTEVGDVCLAIGNPFGIGQTVTMGIISAKGRGLGNGNDSYEDFIQTDAAINPGNSGGALVDAEGRLIGINTAILSRSGGNQGIGFAIPVNMARNVMENLIDHGHVIRGFLGVMIQDVTPALAQEFKLNDGQGALVSEVTPHSPAEKAGVKSGDVITEFNNHAVADSRHLKLQVAETTPGKTVAMKLIRDGREKTIDVKVKELPGSETVAVNNEGEKDQDDSLNGVTVSDIDSQTRSQLGLPITVKGAVVTQIEENSASAEAGLQVGDVIQEINRSPVNGADDAVKLTSHVKDRVALLKVWHKGGSHFIVVDESKKK